MTTLVGSLFPAAGPADLDGLSFLDDPPPWLRDLEGVEEGVTGLGGSSAVPVAVSMVRNCCWSWSFLREPGRTSRIHVRASITFGSRKSRPWSLLLLRLRC